jgi:hypothetical protein
VSKGSTSTPAWTPSEVAERCRALGARVELKGVKYRVYPPDGGGPVFFNAYQESRGVHLPNVLRDLRRCGLDLQEAEQEERERRSARPAPAALARPIADPAIVAAIQAKLAEASSNDTTDDTEEAAVAAPRDTPAAMPRATPFDARRELAELREMIRSQDASHLEMMAQADARIRALEDQLADLLSGRITRPPSITELVRRAVLAWFEAHPGLKVTPALLEMNLDGKLPKGHAKTAVAGACRDLVIAGKLRSGGAGPATGPAALRGIYWLAEESAPGPAKTD